MHQSVIRHWHAYRGWIPVLAFLLALLLPDLLHAASPSAQEYEDESGGHLIIALFAIAIGLITIAVILVLIGIGLALGVAALAVGSILVAIGAVSTSVLFGVLRKSPAAGFRALFIQIGLAVGAVCGICVTLISSWIGQWSSAVGFSDLQVSLDGLWAPLLGAVGGMVGGLLVALLFNLAWGRLAKAAARRWEASRSLKSANPALPG
jgi:hypothetical protein